MDGLPLFGDFVAVFLLVVLLADFFVGRETFAAFFGAVAFDLVAFDDTALLGTFVFLAFVFAFNFAFAVLLAMIVLTIQPGER